MERIAFTTHKGVRILIEDLTNLKAGDEFLSVLKQAEKVIHSQPPKSVLAVMDVSGTQYNAAVLSAMKEFAKANTPYIKTSVVVGIEGLLGIGLSAVSAFSGRSFKQFKDRQSAMDWLVTQA